MRYYKTSQPVPGKGEAWMFYECNDDQTIRRYLTYIPTTREIDKVAKPFIKKLQRPEMLLPAERGEFYQYWGEDDEGLYPTPKEVLREHRQRTAGGATGKHFDPDMTIGEAMAVHPKVAEVFAAFHLGGCSSCGISEYETVGQVCMAYGVDVDLLLEVLEGLLEEEGKEAEAAPGSPAAVQS